MMLRFGVLIIGYSIAITCQWHNQWFENDLIQKLLLGFV